MDIIPFGYSTYVNNENLAEDSNFVVGKGRRPCWGETLDWQVSGTPQVKYLGVYGWLQSPIVEYYIGRYEEGSVPVGTYHTSQGDYELQVAFKNGANIHNPNDEAHLPRKFLQFNVVSLDDVPSEVGPVNLSEHYRGWEELMPEWWPSQPQASDDWYWFPMVGPGYCVVSTEVYGPTTGSSSVTDISIEEYMKIAPLALAVSEAGTPAGDPLKFDLISTRPWTLDLTTVPSWITVTPTVSALAGAKTVKMQIAANTTANNRNANITFSMDGSEHLATAQIYQVATGQGFVPPGAGGGRNLAITRGGSWTADSSDPSWLTVTPSSGTSGTYNLFLSATSNTSGSIRTATVTVTGGGETKTVTTTQAPVSLVASPAAIDIAAAGGTSSVDISANVLWWSAYTTNGGAWLSIAPGSASGAGNGTVSFTVSPNNTAQIRTATITIAGGDVPTRSVVVAQAANPAPPCDPSNRLTNAGFESGSSGWTTWGGTLATTSSPVRTGAASGRVTNRTASWHGPVQSLIGKVTGGSTYTAAVWAKVSGSSSQPLSLTLKTECAGSSPSYTQLDTATGTSSSWVQLSGEFTAPSCTLTSLALYVEGPSAGTTLYVDDASLAQVCP